MNERENNCGSFFERWVDEDAVEIDEVVLKSGFFVHFVG